MHQTVEIFSIRPKIHVLSLYFALRLKQPLLWAYRWVRARFVHENSSRCFFFRFLFSLLTRSLRIKFDLFIRVDCFLFLIICLHLNWRCAEESTKMICWFNCHHFFALKLYYCWFSFIFSVFIFHLSRFYISLIPFLYFTYFVFIFYLFTCVLTNAFRLRCPFAGTKILSVLSSFFSLFLQVVPHIRFILPFAMNLLRAKTHFPVTLSFTNVYLIVLSFLLLSFLLYSFSSPYTLFSMWDREHNQRFRSLWLTEYFAFLLYFNFSFFAFAFPLGLVGFLISAAPNVEAGRVPLHKGIRMQC